jgi:hypothetical protein
MHYNQLTSIEINLKNRLSAPRVSLSHFDQIPARAVAFRRIPAGLRESNKIVTFLRWSFGLTGSSIWRMAIFLQDHAARLKSGEPLPIGLRSRYEPSRLRPGTLSPLRQPTTNRISL